MSDGQNTAAIIGLIKGVAPGIATALAGPAAGAAVAFLSSKLGVPVEKVQETVLGMTPDQLVHMKELDYDFQKFALDNGIKLDLAQIDLNKTEAEVGKNTQGWQAFFIAGWRPYIGWICGMGIGYQFLLRPLFNGIAVLFNGDPTTFPALEIQDLIALVTTMLGHSALRSWDKKNGTANEQ